MHSCHFVCFFVWLHSAQIAFLCMERTPNKTLCRKTALFLLHRLQGPVSLSSLSWKVEWWLSVFYTWNQYLTLRCLCVCAHTQALAMKEPLDADREEPTVVIEEWLLLHRRPGVTGGEERAATFRVQWGAWQHRLCCVLCWVAQLCLTLCNPMDPPWTCQAPLSLEFSRQEYWNGLPCPPPDLWQDLVRDSDCRGSWHSWPFSCKPCATQSCFELINPTSLGYPCKTAVRKLIHCNGEGTGFWVPLKCWIKCG